MLNDKQKILNKNTFLNKRKNAKIISHYEKAKSGYLLLSVFLSLLIIGTLYLLLDVSNIKSIKVEGNVYLKDGDVINSSGLSLNTKYISLLYTEPTNIRMKNNPLYDECSVKLLDDHSVLISVKEKKIIGYAYENNANNLILEDDTRVALNKDNMYLIEKVPLLAGFTKEDTILIEKNLAKVDYKMINEISEMHYYPELKYQDHKIIMRDGNNIFTSVYGLNLLNRYYDIVSSDTSSGHKCYYVEDISGNVYSSACPWETIETKQETKKED